MDSQIVTILTSYGVDVFIVSLIVIICQTFKKFLRDNTIYLCTGLGLIYGTIVALSSDLTNLSGVQVLLESLKTGIAYAGASVLTYKHAKKILPGLFNGLESHKEQANQGTGDGQKNTA